MKRLIFPLFFFFLLSKSILAHGTIIVKGVMHEEGYIDVKIYIDKKSFLKEKLAFETIRKKANIKETIIPLSKVHEGPIAIVVYHDENSDGKLNTGFFWRPKEGYAFSNKYIPSGSPSFSKALINLMHGETITIYLNY